MNRARIVMGTRNLATKQFTKVQGHAAAKGQCWDLNPVDISLQRWNLYAHCLLPP